MFDVNSYRIVMPSQLPKPAVRVTLGPQSQEDVSSTFRSPQPVIQQDFHQPQPPTLSRQTSSSLSVSSSARVAPLRSRESLGHQPFFPERREEARVSHFSPPQSDAGLDSSAQNHVFLRQQPPQQQLPQPQPSTQPQLFSVPPDPRFRISAALAAAGGSQSQPPGSPQPIITDPRLLGSSSGLIRQDVNGPNFSHQLVTLPRSPAPESSQQGSSNTDVGNRFSVGDQTFIPGPPPFTDTSSAPMTQLPSSPQFPSQFQSQPQSHFQPQRFAAASSSSFASHQQPPPQPQTSLTPAQIAALNFFNGSPNPQAFSHLKERAEKQREEEATLRAQQEEATRVQEESAARAEAQAQAEANARARAQQEAAIRAAQEAALRVHRQQEERDAQLRAQRNQEASLRAQQASLRAQQAQQDSRVSEAASRAKAAREAAVRAQQQAEAAAEQLRLIQEQQSRAQRQQQGQPPFQSQQPFFQRLPDVNNPTQLQPTPQPQSQANSNNLPLDPFTSHLDFMRTTDRRNRITSTSDQRQQQPQPSFTARPVTPQEFNHRPSAPSRPTAAPQLETPSQSGSFKPANLQIQQLPPDSDNDGIPGVANKDYPTLVSIPETSFSCSKQPLTGYYADTETACQVVHFCQTGGTQDSFLCPNGTIFNQEKFSCQWWYEVNCANAPKFYILNDNLYRVPQNNNNANSNARNNAASSSSSVSSSSSSASSSSSSSSKSK